MTGKSKAATAELPTTYEAGKFYTLPIDLLNKDPNQPRKYFDPTAIDDLAASITKHGVIQPILFRLDDDGKLFIVAGERRYLASIKAKQVTIPAQFIERDSSAIALIENLLREDLTPLEVAEGLLRLKEEANYKNKDLAAVIGKAESTISEILSLNDLPEKIKKVIHDNKDFSRRQLVEVAKGKDEKEKIKIFKKIQKKNVSRDELRQDRPGRDDVSTLMAMIANLASKLNKVKVNDLRDDSRDFIKTHLKMLAELIKEKIN